MARLSRTITVSPGVWATVVLVLLKKAYPKVELTANNVNTLLLPITTKGTYTQQGGFLRDNNPWNIGTGCSPSHAYGGTPWAPYGPDQRCSGGPVYLNTFSTVLDGAKATAQYLIDHGAVGPLERNATPSEVLGGTWYSGSASASPAGGAVTHVPLTAAAAIVGGASVGPTTGPAGPVGPNPSGPGTPNPFTSPVIGCNAKGSVAGTPGLPIFHTGSVTFTYCEAKALIGGLCVAAGGVLMLAGITLIAAYGLARSPVAQIAGSIPGPQARVVDAAARVTGGKRPPASSRAPRPDRNDRAYERDRDDAVRERAARRRREVRGTPREGSSAPLRRPTRTRTRTATPVEF